MDPLAVYAAPELGQYGYVEKPWYLPGSRLTAFLDQLEAHGLTDAVAFRTAPQASLAELMLFHDEAYVRELQRRCAENRGSLDRASPAVNRRSRLLLQAIGQTEGPATEVGLAPVLAELSATLADFTPFLESEGVVHCDPDASTVRLTDAGRAFVADPRATLGGPTYARAHVEQAARWICGATVDATRRILAGELTTAFVPIAGFHHAHRAEARMYCLYNDPGVALAQALRTVDGPVAYIDVDIHQGDGVYRAFADNPRVVVADLHEDSRAEPGTVRQTEDTGTGAAAGTKLTLAIGPEHDDASYLRAFDRAEAFVRAARPSFVVFEAGVDGLADDPMSNQRLTPAVFGEVTRRVKSLADDCANGRLLVLGGGGYELKGTARAWVAVVEGLLGS